MWALGSFATFALALVLGGGPALADDAVEGDAVAGEGLFRLCVQCHSVTPNQNRLGPSLYGVVGRDAGSVANYRYSPAMRESGIIWTPEELDRFLEHPQETVPRSRMAFTGMSDPKQRTDIIAYLEELSDD